MPLLIRRARILTLVSSSAESGVLPAKRARRGSALRELGILPRADVLVQDDQIVAVGPDLVAPPDTEIVDADGRVLMPGFIDCHTHACWAGDVLDRWEKQPAGEPRAGLDGIVHAVRESTRKQLAAALRVRLDQILAGGTTTVELKSGYGLTLDAELKMLHAIPRAAHEFPGTVVSTALLGHVIDGDPAHFTRLVVREILPAVWHEFPGITIDARCAADAWPVEACVRLFERARKHGLDVRVDADEFAPTGMIPEALKLHARSIDGLEHASKNDLLALAATDTFGVMLPARSFHAGNRYARAGFFVDQGGLLALASDFNPVTSPTHSMPFVIATAVRGCGLTPAEAIAACTVNAAAVLGLTDRGTIEPGQRADLILLRHRDERLLAYEIGGNPVDLVIAAGRKVSPKPSH